MHYKWQVHCTLVLSLWHKIPCPFLEIIKDSDIPIKKNSCSPWNETTLQESFNPLSPRILSLSQWYGSNATEISTIPFPLKKPTLISSLVQVIPFKNPKIRINPELILVDFRAVLVFRLREPLSRKKEKCNIATVGQAGAISLASIGHWFEFR